MMMINEQRSSLESFQRGRFAAMLAQLAWDQSLFGTIPHADYSELTKEEERAEIRRVRLEIERIYRMNYTLVARSSDVMLSRTDVLADGWVCHVPDFMPNPWTKAADQPWPEDVGTIQGRTDSEGRIES